MTSAPQWNVSGDYFETCSCDYLCPCTPSNLTGKQTKGDCHFAFLMHVETGRYGDVTLDGLNFAIVGRAPGPAMADGNIEVGLILDERATQQQQEALTQIGSGGGGGPMAALGPLVGSFLGATTGRFEFQKDGLKRSIKVGDLLDQAVEGIPGARQDEPLYIDNTVHPANSRLALAHAVRSHIHALGLNWDDTTGANNGHFAPFTWRS